jgi:NADPH2:quinone reductase
MKNRQLRITAWGSDPQIHLAQKPEPGPGEVLVKVEASSLCFTDTLISRGIYPGLKQKPPLVLGYDFVGKVEALGQGVSQWQKGDRVAALSITGANADWLSLRADHLAAVPASVSASQAESLILSWVTAWQMLERLGQVRPHGWILVQGAAGAVGNALVQLARLKQLQVVATASPRDHAWLSAQGVAATIDYNDPERWTKIKAAAPKGFDAVFESIGPGNILPSGALLAPDGILVCYGFVAAARGVKGPSPLVMLRSLLMVGGTFARLAWLGRRQRQAFYDIKASAVKDPQAFKADLEALFELLAAGQIRPQVNEVPFAEAVAAHAQLTQGGIRGRLSLVHDLETLGLFGDV